MFAHTWLSENIGSLRYHLLNLADQTEPDPDSDEEVEFINDFYGGDSDMECDDSGWRL